ncbi:hypothetical protein ACFWGP_05540 [Agromyces sp. NPDC127015]|uniref:hypothetical protein n=1 Tax=Agromyces sp. NPDC127015 TaxID=3347108 RepID=UPI00365E8C7E
MTAEQANDNPFADIIAALGKRLDEELLYGSIPKGPLREYVAGLRAEVRELKAGLARERRKSESVIKQARKEHAKVDAIRAALGIG